MGSIRKAGAVSAYLCDPASAPAEFLLLKSQYQAETGRAVERGALFFQIRQAFRPARSRRRRQTKSAMKQPCAGQRASISSLSVPTLTQRAHSQSHLLQLHRPGLFPEIP